MKEPVRVPPKNVTQNYTKEADGTVQMLASKRPTQKILDTQEPGNQKRGHNE